MHSPPLSTLLFTFLFWLFISWALYWLLGRLHPYYTVRTVRYGYWGMSILSIAIYYTNRVTGGVSQNFTFLIYFLCTWIITQGILLGSLLLIEGLRILSRLFQPRISAPQLRSPSRRRFLKYSAAVLPVLAGGLTAQTVYATSQNLRVNRVRLTYPNLPQQAQGLKVFQVSDTHIGSFFNLRRLDALIEIIRQEAPDVVVITGDFIDDLDLLEPAVEKLRQLHPSIPHGIYFCWGNHESFRDQKRIRIALMKSPVIILENDSRVLIDGDQPICLLGVDYPWARNLQEQDSVRKRLFEQTLQNVPKGAFSLCITHHPNFISEAFLANMPLTLAGHTHGGQVAIYGYSIVPFQYRYMSGLYRQGDCVAYVNNGAGQWFPFRFGRPAEVAVFTLTSEHYA